MTDKITVTPVAGACGLDRIAKLYNDKATSDVTFIVGPNATEFFGHTLIIGSASDVLKANFSSDWKDRNIIKLEDVNIEVFEVLMLYIYKDEISLKGTDLLDVLELAHRYMITGLVASLTATEVFKLNATSHVWKYLTFAVTVNDIELIIRCLEVIDRKTETVFRSSDFQGVASNVIGLFIGRDTLNIEEGILFEYLLNWSDAECRRRKLQVTPGNQRKVMESFIHKIRFAIMTLEEFTSFSNKGILTAAEMKSIRNAITSNRKDITGFDFNPREEHLEGKCAVGRKGKLGVIVNSEYYVCLPCALTCRSVVYKDIACKCYTRGGCKLRERRVPEPLSRT